MLKRVRALRPFPDELGWRPAIWLVYLLFPLVDLLVNHVSVQKWGLEIAGILLFLALYCYDFWSPSGRQEWWLIASFCALGAVLCPAVTESNLVFFVYGAASAGYQARPRSVLPGLLIVALSVAALLAFGLLSLSAVTTTAVISVAAGVASFYYRHDKEITAQLRQARRDVERVAQLAERERIARDLHDLLGHSLSLIVLKSELARKLTPVNPARAATEIAEVETISRQALAQVRQAVRGYRGDGLTAELGQVRASLESAGIATEIEAKVPALPPAMDGALVLVLREGVTNVLRHSRARTCRIAIAGDERAVCLQVSDDGQGLGGAVEGAGLRGMRERLGALGGGLDLRSNADPGAGETGTTVTARLPLALGPTPAEPALERI